MIESQTNPSFQSSATPSNAGNSFQTGNFQQKPSSLSRNKKLLYALLAIIFLIAIGSGVVIFQNFNKSSTQKDLTTADSTFAWRPSAVTGTCTGGRVVGASEATPYDYEFTFILTSGDRQSTFNYTFKSKPTNGSNKVDSDFKWSDLGPEATEFGTLLRTNDQVKWSATAVFVENGETVREDYSDFFTINDSTCSASPTPTATSSLPACTLGQLSATTQSGKFVFTNKSQCSAEVSGAVYIKQNYPSKFPQKLSQSKTVIIGPGTTLVPSKVEFTLPVNCQWQADAVLGKDLPATLTVDYFTPKGTLISASEGVTTCTSPTPTPVVTPVVTPSSSPTPFDSATPTATPTGSPPIGGPSNSPTPTPTASPTPIASVTPTPTVVGQATSLPTPTVVAQATSVPEPTTVSQTAVADSTASQTLPNAGVQNSISLLVIGGVSFAASLFFALRKKRYN